LQIQTYAYFGLMKKTYTLNILLIFLLCMTVALSAFAQNDTITAENAVQQGFGSGLNTRTYYDTIIMPHSLSNYGQLKMHIYLNCQGGTCDPYDRLAHVRLSRINSTQWYEIARYITPFGIACDWDFDVTDYRYMLTDTIVLESFIDTWVNPAWLVTMKFEFLAGVPSTDSIHIDNLWNNYGLVYGDTTQPVNIPPFLTILHAGADSVKLKMTTTGHGQGNLNNAAEFFQATDSVLLNDSVYFLHSLWRTDCATNVCNPQHGTYQYSRAGWCPGKSVTPANFNITPMFTAGQSVKIGYNLESYFNTCSPNDPSCATSGSCPSCAYNSGGHTQPYYAIDGQLITYYKRINTGISDQAQTDISISPNPGKGLYTLHVGIVGAVSVMMVYDYLGNVVLQDRVSAIDTKLNLQNVAQGVYFVKVQDGQSSRILKVVKE
jgi:hypothetical protein